jgi:hypothetical protein
MELFIAYFSAFSSYIVEVAQNIIFAAVNKTDHRLCMRISKESVPSPHHIGRDS